MKKIQGILAALALAGFSYQAQATTTVSFVQSNCGGTPTECTIIQSYIDQQKALLDDADKIAESSLGFIASEADATAVTSRGMGVNYAPGPKIFIVGIGVGMGMSTGGAAISSVMSDPGAAEGFAMGLNLMGGINLGLFPIPDVGPVKINKMKAYFNIMSYQMPEVSGFSFKYTSVGMHLQYPLIPEVGMLLVKWGGVQLTSGFEYTSLGMTMTYDKDVTIDSTTQSTWASTTTGSMDTSVFSIPVEVSTSARLLFLTPFIGLGVDLNFGGTDVGLTAKGPVSVMGTQVGDATIKTTQTLGVTNADFRIFGGTQLDIFVLKLLLQGNYSINTGSVGLMAGARLAF